MPVPTRDEMKPPAGERKSFSTVGLPAARRIELWESHNAAALIGLDVRADGELDATETNVRLPLVRLARVSGSAHAVERSPAAITRSPADSVAIYLTLRGDARFTGADGTRALRPGDVLVCATDQPFTRGFARGLEELVVTVPWAALDVSRASRPVTASFTAGQPLSTAARYARALARLTGHATGNSTGSGRALPPDERTVLDLAAVLVAGRDAATATAHRAAARLYIEEHLTDPGLSADRVAAAIGISERQLSRVFAAMGMSVPRHILTRRLELAYSVLAATPPARGEAGATVAEVAARCGFTSANYFSHAFRQHFGLRAGDVGRPNRG
jgi:AraC-like DNA-binding protein